jgi:hypothetical protein
MNPLNEAPLQYHFTVNGSTLAGIFNAAGSVLQDRLVAEMKDILNAQGYVVEVPCDWESPKELCARLGISVKTFCVRMKEPLCPKPHDTIRNERGIDLLRSHSVLDAFLTKNKRTPNPAAKAAQTT